MKIKILLAFILLTFSAKTFAQCNASFTYSTNAIGMTVFSATNFSSNSPTSTYSWNFGNSTSSSFAIDSLMYAYTGYYTVCLFVSDPINNCIDSSCQTIWVSNNSTTPCTGSPTAGTIIANTTTPCPGSTVSFNLSGCSNSANISYLWQRTNSCIPPLSWITLPGSNVNSYSIIATGNYGYRCIVTCLNTGNSDTTSTICITPFGYNPASSCYGFPIISMGDTLNYIKEVSINTLTHNTSTLGNPLPHYVDYTSNQMASLINIPILNPGSPQNISIKHASGANQYAVVWIDLNHNSTFTDAGEGFYSNINAGANGTSTININIPFTSINGYTRMRVRSLDQFSLISANDSTAYGEAEDYIINITPANCSASFSSSLNSNNALTLNSTSTSVNPISYKWYVNNVLVDTNASFTYSNMPGTYAVCLAIHNNSGCSDSVCQNIIIPNFCNPSFTYTLGANGLVDLFITNLATNSSNTYYNWRVIGIDSGNVQSLNLVNGTYNVCLHTIDSFNNVINCIDSSCQTITITNFSPCNASYYIYPDTNAAPHTYIGVNTSTGSGLTYTWDWGDGSTSTGQYPSHTYSSTGIYTIKLIVDNGLGCIDSFSAPQTINKTAAMATINFLNPLSIKNEKIDKLSIFPNPTCDNIKIQGIDGNNYYLEIMNLNGSVLKKALINNNQTFNISFLAKNLYIIKLKEDNGDIHYFKLIKN